MVPRPNRSLQPSILSESLGPSSIRLHAPLRGPRGRAPWARDILGEGPRTLAGPPLFGPDRVWTAEGTDGRTALHSTKSNGPFLELSVAEGKKESVVITLTVSEDEGFYGFGESFQAFRRRKGKVNFFARESPAFTQDKQTYSAFPAFLSDKGYLVLVLNAHAGSARLQEPPGRVVLEFTGGEADFIVVYGPTFREILFEYTRLTGRPPLLPLWAFGLWNTSYPVEEAASTIARVRKHRSMGVPLDCVILDYHWENSFHDFRWRPSLFPRPDEFIAELNELGVRLGLIYTPFTNRNALPLFKLAARVYARNAPDGTPFFAREAAPELYAEGVARGYFAADDVVWWLGRGGMLDVTNPEAIAWWFAGQRRLLDQGVAFFKNDDGEYLPLRNRSHSGLRPAEYHNLYGFYYGRAVYSKSQAHVAPARALVFSRMVWAGSQRFPAVFLGDQRPRFDDLRRALRAGLNLSLLGFAYWGADIMGLYRTPTQEIHQRYAQATLLGPIARYFSTPRDPQRDPWGNGKDCLESFRTLALFRMRLLPYLYAQARVALDTGLPIVRPLVLEFPGDEPARDVDDQFLIGDRLMAAPVLLKGARSRTVYFPEGSWHEWWTGRRQPGGRSVEIAALSGRLPLFVRGGAPLVLGPPLQQIPRGHSFGQLDVHFFAPFWGEAMIYEDDGETLGYTEGHFSRQSVRVTSEPDPENPNTVTIALGAAEGDHRVPASRDYTLCVHGAGRPLAVTIDGVGAPEEHTRYDGERLELEVSLSAGTNRAYLVVLKLEKRAEGGPRS